MTVYPILQSWMCTHACQHTIYNTIRVSNDTVMSVCYVFMRPLSFWPHFSVPQSNRKRMCLRFYCNYVWFVKLLNNIYLNIGVWINTHQVITQPLEAMMYGIFVMYRNHMVLRWFYTNSIARTSVSLPFTVNWFISAAVTVWNITW